MKILRAAAALALVATGTFATGVLYARNEGGNFWDWKLWTLLSVAATVAVISFLVTRATWPESLRGAVVGVAFTYATWITLLLIVDGSKGLMWLPVIVIFAIPFTAPLLLSAWFASGLLLSLRSKPNNALQATREHARA